MYCLRRLSCAAIYLHGRIWRHGRNTITRHGPDFILIDIFLAIKIALRILSSRSNFKIIYTRVHRKAVC